MRIAITTNLFPPIQTGTAHYAQELAQNLARAGHDVTVITCSLINEHSQEIVDGYKVFRLPSYKLPVSKLLLGFEQFYLGYIPGNKRRVKEILVQERIEVVHQCGHLLDLDYLIPRVCKRLQIPAVLSLHTIIHDPKNKLVDWMMKFIDRTIVKWFSANHYQVLIALDAEIASYAHERYSHPNIFIVQLCLDAEMLEYPTAKYDDAPLLKILSVGHITSMRHRIDLIRAVDSLHNDGIPVQLTIVGKVLEQTPVQLVHQLGLSDVVHFVGEVPRTQIMEMMRDFHVEAHWITNPALGTAILEAMALGVPAMTYAYPGLYGDIPLVDMENIIFVIPGNIVQISNQLALLAQNTALRATIGVGGRKIVQDYLTWPIAIEKFESIYSDVISG